MKHQVLLSGDAEDDLVDIHRFATLEGGSVRADALLDRLEAACRALSHLPLRGRLPPELDRIGITEFREVHVAAYRIFYEVTGRKVVIHAVLDGRRELPELLLRRLLR